MFTTRPTPASTMGFNSKLHRNFDTAESFRWAFFAFKDNRPPTLSDKVKEVCGLASFRVTFVVSKGYQLSWISCILYHGKGSTNTCYHAGSKISLNSVYDIKYSTFNTLIKYDQIISYHCASNRCSSKSIFGSCPMNISHFPTKSASWKRGQEATQNLWH